MEREENRLCRMAEETAGQLAVYPQLSQKERIKRAVRRLLGRGAATKSAYGWPGGLLALGLYRFVQARDDSGAACGACEPAPAEVQARDALDDYFTRWQQKGFAIGSLEETLAAYVLLLWGEKTGREDFLCGAKKAVDWLKAYPALENGAFPYRADQKNGHVYVDALGMAAPLLMRYGLLREDAQALRLGCLQLELFLRCGMDSETYLPYHGYQDSGAVRHGIVGWGRAVGWLLLGLSEGLAALPADAAGVLQDLPLPFLRESFRRLAKTAAAYQRPDGTFAWQLMAKEGPADSSALAMYAYSAALGVRAGLLSREEFAASLDAAKTALAGCLEGGRVGQASGECGGFGIYPQIYGQYPWGQGPALGFFAMWERERC